MEVGARITRRAWVERLGYGQARLGRYSLLVGRGLHCDDRRSLAAELAVVEKDRLKVLCLAPVAWLGTRSRDNCGDLYLANGGPEWAW